MSFKIMYFSDLHLSRRMPVTIANWELCLRAIDEARPDLVLVGGDLLFDDPDNAEDRALAQAHLARIAAPWRITPGNHDVGDTLPPTEGKKLVTPARLEAYRDSFGEVWWALDAAGWKIIGMNNMLSGSGLEDEETQDAFVKDAIGGWRGPVALFVHKPLCFADFGETETTKYTMRPAARGPLLDLFAGYDLRMIGSGHCHTARNTMVSGIRTVWAPSTAIVIGNNTRLPDMSAGWVTYTFTDADVAIDLSARAALPPADLGGLLDIYGTLGAIPPALLHDFGSGRDAEARA